MLASEESGFKRHATAMTSWLRTLRWMRPRLQGLRLAGITLHIAVPTRLARLTCQYARWPPIRLYQGTYPLYWIGSTPCPLIGVIARLSKPWLGPKASWIP